MSVLWYKSNCCFFRSPRFPSPAGVLFTRNPANGTNELYGEFLLNAQGEDVVAGIRTPMPISLMKEKMPNIYTELHDTVKMLERHMHDMQVRILSLLLGVSCACKNLSSCLLLFLFRQSRVPGRRLWDDPWVTGNL
jgi:hypothetical protein